MRTRRLCLYLSTAGLLLPLIACAGPTPPVAGIPVPVTQESSSEEPVDVARFRLLQGDPAPCSSSTLVREVDYYKVQWKFGKKGVNSLGQLVGHPSVFLAGELIPQGDGRRVRFVMDPRNPGADRHNWVSYVSEDGRTPTGGGPFVYRGFDLEIFVLVMDMDAEVAQNYLEDVIQPTLGDAGDLAATFGIPGGGQIGRAGKTLTTILAKAISRFSDNDVIAGGGAKLIKGGVAQKVIYLNGDGARSVELWVEREPAGRGHAPSWCGPYNTWLKAVDKIAQKRPMTDSLPLIESLVVDFKANVAPRLVAQDKHWAAYEGYRRLNTTHRKLGDRFLDLVTLRKWTSRFEVEGEGSIDGVEVLDAATGKLLIARNFKLGRSQTLITLVPKTDQVIVRASLQGATSRTTTVWVQAEGSNTKYALSPKGIPSELQFDEVFTLARPEFRILPSTSVKRRSVSASGAQ